MAEATKTPDLSALAGKIKLVLSSFPQWDVRQSSESQRERALSDFEQPQTAFILGEVENCQPAVVIGQQDLSEDDSHSNSSSSSDQDSVPVAIRPDLELQASSPRRVIPTSQPAVGPIDPRPSLPEDSSSPTQHRDPRQAQGNTVNATPPKDEGELSYSTKPTQQSSSPSSLPGAKLAPVSSAQSARPMMVVSSQSPTREPVTKVPIMVTRSEDVSHVREELAKTRVSVPEHKERRACNGCSLS